MSEQYLSAGEAIEILKMPPATFYRFAKEGKIKKYYPNGVNKHAEYNAHEIAHLASKYRRETQPQEEGETDWIKNSDMGHMYDLEYTVYGDETGNPSIIRRWYEQNPYICRVLYNKADRRDFWGAINMLPLKEETIFKLLKGEMRDIDLDPQKDVLTFEQPGEYNFYVASVIIQPEKRQHFPMLINSMFDFWCEQAPERTLGKIYGRIVATDGELMAKRLFFSPLWHISENAYVLDLKRPNPSRFVQALQHCIQEKQTIFLKLVSH